MRARILVWCGLLALPASLLPAAEHRGVVKSGGLPIPGASVTASQGQTRVTVASDEQGRYVFSDLAPGQWSVAVEMFGFAPASRTVRVPDGAETAWDLTLATRPAVAQRPAGSGARLGLSRAGAGQGNEVLSELESLSSVAASPASLQQDANEALLVSGSLSRGLQMEPQNLMGPPGMGMGMGMGPGGPGGMEGPPPEGAPGMMGGPGGPGGRPGMMAAGGPGRTGGGPGMMGGPGMGGPGMGGPGTGGPPMGGPGGPLGGPGGEMGGGRGGRMGAMGGRPEWAGQRGVSAFGNRQSRGRESIRGMAGLSFNASALDAKPYSLTGNAIERPDYSKVRFNVGLGGRLVIPKLIRSESTFFFLNYSGGRASNAVSRVATVPSLLEREGDFSASQTRGAVAIYDPTSNQPFAGNRIPAARIDSAAAGLLSYIPEPNLPGTVQNYQFVTSVPQNNDMFSLRLGHSLSRRDRLSGGFQIQRRHSENAQLFGFRYESDGRGSTWNVSWTHNITTTLINDLHASFSRNRSETVPHFTNGANVARELGIQGASTEPRNFGPPNLSFTNFGDLSDGNPSLRRDQNTGVGNCLTWVRGKHTLKFGFDYRRNQANLFTDDNGRGSFSFSGLLTSAFDSSGNPLANTGFDMADFLLGLPQTSAVRWGNSSMYFRGSNYSAYAQDDWRVSSGLSFSLGLRYEYTQPMYEKYGRMANLDVAGGFTDVAVVTPDIAGPYSGKFPKGLVNPDRNNFSPRLGVAWKPNPRKSLQIRGGYGVYFNGSVYGAMVSRLGQQPPFAFANSFTTSVANPLTIREGLLGSAATGITNTLAVARDYAVGYAQTWNLSVQRQLPFSLIGEIGYLATKGTRLDTQRLPNQAPPGSPADSENRRPIPYAVGFLYESAEGNSIMHSGQLRLMRRFRHGVSFQALYTWSKSIDNVSTYGGGQAVVAQNDRDLAAERGLSSFDQRHNLNLSFMLTSPAGRGPALLDLGRFNGFLKDWSLNGGIVARSGAPLTATVLGNRADSGGTGVVGSGRADATGQAIGSGDGFFNLAAFALPAANAFGNAGRNTIPGPGQLVMNAGVGRSFRLGNERRHAEFRVEADNALNSVNYTRYGTTINASNYGLATSAGSMRSVTANLRFRF